MVLVTRLFIGGGQFGFLGWLGWALLCLLLSVLAAALIFHLVDEPLMRRFGRRAGR
ncbi:hypothetical protein B7C42_08336 [Nocardia cerradoensis]|uniref:Uncharacterized protein n=2 Tax=Nocardia TaxID=1817 RepID=A0A231GSK7_9NOCA|nr:hypothetical protein B7C42_08336 [Nocardia cerradoensis]